MLRGVMDDRRRILIAFAATAHAAADVRAAAAWRGKRLVFGVNRIRLRRGNHRAVPADEHHHRIGGSRRFNRRIARHVVFFANRLIKQRAVVIAEADDVTIKEVVFDDVLGVRREASLDVGDVFVPRTEFIILVVAVPFAGWKRNVFLVFGRSSCHKGIGAELIAIPVAERDDDRSFGASASAATAARLLAFAFAFAIVAASSAAAAFVFAGRLFLGDGFKKSVGGDVAFDGSQIFVPIVENISVIRILGPRWRRAVISVVAISSIRDFLHVKDRRAIPVLIGDCVFLEDFFENGIGVEA